MTAIYKRELRSYLTSMIGYILYFLSCFLRESIFRHISWGLPIEI